MFPAEKRLEFAGKAPISAVSCGIQWRESSTWVVIISINFRKIVSVRSIQYKNRRKKTIEGAYWTMLHIIKKRRSVNPQVLRFRKCIQIKLIFFGMMYFSYKVFLNNNPQLTVITAVITILTFCQFSQLLSFQKLILTPTLLWGVFNCGEGFNP
jgi:hypothetical protein